MSELGYPLTIFACLLLEALPYLLLGVVISSFILVFVDYQRLPSLLPRNPILAVILGIMLGMILPVCQYGNIPVTRRLLLQGAPVAMAISFFIAAPTINPIVIWLSMSQLPPDSSIAFFRILLTMAIAIIIGGIFSSHKGSLSLTSQGNLDWRNSLLKSGSFIMYDRTVPINKFWLFLENIVKELIELGGILAISCAIGTAVQIFLPPGQLLAFLPELVSKLPLMPLYGAELSLGTVGNTFYAPSLIPNITKGSVLAFLLFSSIVDIKTLGLLLGIIRFKPVMYLVLLSFSLTLLFTMSLDFHLVG